MSDAVPNDLKAHVERIVSPVPASRSRRRTMREELLAHLWAIYDEELGRLGDEEAALREAKQRFGHPAGLSGELQKSVPFLERVFLALSQKKENSMWRWLLVLGCVAILVGLGFVFPAIAQLRNQGTQIGIAVTLLIFGLAVAAGGLASLGYGIKAFRTRSS